MTITPERALADADRIEKMSDAERHRAPMFGVPYSIKDLNWTKDIPTSMGSKNYENFMPPADDETVIRMRNSGGILLGKTTTPEFGGRPTTEGGLCPPARNPWNLEHTAGGSSGGAGSALAAGLGPLAQGSDGGGSIRIPSACCGVVGIKPSRGRISLSPIAGEAWAGFATDGPMARSVRDVATMLDVMHGPVVGDPYWAPAPVTSFKAAVEIPPRHLRIGMISKTSLAKVDSETLDALDSAAKVFEEMGHRVEPISCDPGGRLRDIVMPLICAGVGSTPVKDINLVDPVVRALWDAGQKITAVEYITKVTQMHNMSREIVQELAPYDAVISPVTSRPAVKLGTLPSHPGKYLERAARMDSVHVPIQRDGSAGVFGAQRIQQIGAAACDANRRSSGRRGDDHRARRAIRKSAPMEGQTSAARLARIHVISGALRARRGEGPPGTARNTAKTNTG